MTNYSVTLKSEYWTHAENVEDAIYITKGKLWDDLEKGLIDEVFEFVVNIIHTEQQGGE